MVYHIKLNEAMGPVMSFAGIAIDTHSANAWVGAVFLLLTGAGLFELARREFVRQWGQAQADIEAQIARAQAL
jgi:branched-chain amino acid transport system permease protein